MASISDVAKLAGVSRSTVSIACNNKGYVSKETREKIERAMKELNYTPSELGRNLKSRQSHIIGIIIPDIAHPFFSAFVKHAEKALYGKGYKTMVCGTAGREDVEQDYLDMLERKTMDGVIMGAHSLEVSNYLRVSRPILTLDRYLAEQIPTVRADKRQIGELAAALFAARGRKRIAQLVSSHTIRNYESERDETFRRCMRQSGAEVVDVSVGYNTFTPEQYAAAAERVFELCPDADGILGVDMAAIACMKEAARRGRRVPEDMSIVAIDGTYVTRLGEREVTAVMQPVQELAQQSVELIVSMVEGRGAQAMDRVLPVSVQEGGTL
ncbi:MAG: LacI family DNA-binding transcriptional regulator [Eubacteriales bacterium]|nr:LacI family DNA-binding transcriptional regulator [Eubacteriales bacterium]